MEGSWEFHEDGSGRWRWRSRDASGSQRESAETFKSGVDCVVHAVRNGYLAGTPLARADSSRGRTPAPESVT